MSVNIDVEVQGLDAILKEFASLSQDKIEAASRMALRSTAAKAKAESVRAITSRFAISRDLVRNSIFVDKPKRGQLVTFIRLFGSPTRRGRSMNVIRFLERSVTLAEMRRRRKSGTHKELRFRFTKGGPLKTIEGAFIGNQGRTVFRRVGDTRLPIEPVQVIGVSQMFRTKPIYDRIIKRIQTDLPNELRRALTGKAKGYL